MTNKAYIVANEQQEREVLEKLEKEGMIWCGGEKPTQIIPSNCYFGSFPYVIYVGERLYWNRLSQLTDEEIVYDGRKEEHMSDKYVVSQEFMNKLEEWKKRGNTDVYFVGSYDISMLPIDVIRWWDYPEINNFEQNNRLIAILRWVNGEDVFEVEKPKKWVVRSKGADALGRYGYLDCYDYVLTGNIYERTRATKFDTKEEAESWANAHQEVVEVVDV